MNLGHFSQTISNASGLFLCPLSGFGNVAVEPGHSVPARVANTREETSVFSPLSDITPWLSEQKWLFLTAASHSEPGSAGFSPQPGLHATGTAVSSLQVTGKAPLRPV